jgi:hypothetical protein
MASADFSQQLLSVPLNYLHPHVCEISRGKTSNLLSIYRHLLHTLYLFSLSDFVLISKLVLQNVPDDVRVPPTGNLPLASFRFHLTMDTLALTHLAAKSFKSVK